MGRVSGSVRRNRRGAGRAATAVTALVAAAALLAAACAAPPPTPPGPGPLTPAGKATLTQLKKSHYGQLAQADATRIGNGTLQPFVEFTVEQTPPSIFVNWVVPDAQAADFAAAAELPPGFSLAKVRILESDPTPRYWLSLNVYRVSGITTGLRAEWSTYVDDGNGEPRFMILRARAADGSLDPLGPLAPPEPILHSVDAGGTITTAMNRTELVGGTPVVTPDNLFNSTIQLPDPADQQLATPTPEWFGANDFIFWLNGVNDRVLQNTSALDPRLLDVDLADVTLDDDSEWAPYLDPVPAHVLVYLDAIEFTISPWWNVTETDGLVDAATIAELSPLKRSIYGGLANSLALGVLGGTGEATRLSTVENSPPSVRWHWEVPAGQLDAFRTAVGLPPGLDLAPLRLESTDADAAYWLTLHVHQRTGEGAGVRAEWITYVDDGDGVRTLVLDVRSDTTQLDPVNLFRAPDPVELDLVTGSVIADVAGPDPLFSSTVPIPPVGSEVDALPSRDWVAATDLRYWRNGVADRVVYDSTLFDPRTSVDPAAVVVDHTGPWAAFTATSPDKVWIDRGPTDTVINPWWNLSQL